MNPFSRSSPEDQSAEYFDEPTAFEPAHLPEPGPFLVDHDVLEGDDHVAIHELAHELFEERGVYDVTFGYNLARLNLDRRHSDAGFRYAVDADDPSVLRAEFTPTTEFCPQADVLGKGAFRAWNGLADRHEYDVVRIRIDADHHQAKSVNDTLEELEETFLETGSVGDTNTGAGGSSTSPF